MYFNWIALSFKMNNLNNNNNLAVNLIFNNFTVSEIWDALRAAAEADLNLAQAIVDSAGVIVTSADMTICYDERGMYIFVLFFFPFCHQNLLRTSL